MGKLSRQGVSLSLWKRTYLPSFALLALLAVASAGDAVAAGAATIRQVVLSSDAIPGRPGEQFGGFLAPSINAHGAVAFSDNFGNAIYTNAHGAHRGSLFRAVGAGRTPPGVLGAFSGVDSASLNNDGSFVFRGFGADSADRGLYLRQPSGKLILVADASTRRPGTADTFSSLAPGQPLGSNGGAVVFSHATTTTQGVYRGRLGSSPAKLTLAELVSSEGGFVAFPGFEGPLGYAVNDAGGAAMVLVDANALRGVFSANPSGTIRKIVREGDVGPGGKRFTGDLGAPAINNKATIAFGGTLGDGDDFAIFLKPSKGGFTKLVDTRTAVPGHPGITFRGFGATMIADDGRVVFEGIYSLPNLLGRPPLRLEGIYLKSSNGLTIMFDQSDGISVNGKKISLIETDISGEQSVLDMSVDARFVSFTDTSTTIAFAQRLPQRASGIFTASRNR